jgi:hypothetical protein
MPYRYLLNADTVLYDTIPSVGISRSFEPEVPTNCLAYASESQHYNLIVSENSFAKNYVDRLAGGDGGISSSTGSPEFYQRKYAIKYFVKPLVTEAMASVQTSRLVSNQLMSRVEEVMKCIDLNSELLRGQEQLVRRYVVKYVCKAVSTSMRLT